MHWKGPIMMRVGIVSLQHESNTFSLEPTTLAHFEKDVLLRGEAVRQGYGGSHHEVAGFFQGLEEAGFEAVPLLMAWTVPGGVVTAEALQELWRKIEEELDQAGQLDGFLVAPHGAGVSEIHRDMDGWWLSRLRERVGDLVPVICTLDPHANVSERMVSACDASIAYRTNPHLDQKARGLEAARLLERTLRGEIKPVQALACPSVAINIERQLTSALPSRRLYELADAMKQQPKVLSNSVLLGYPYADVEEMGSGFIVVTDNDPELARTLASELANYLWEHREEFVGEMVGIEEALARAKQAAKPVCLLDMGDNIGGGSPADATLLAQAVHERGDMRGFVCLYDPDSAEQARAAGLGKRLRLRMGGRTDPSAGAPLEIEVVVTGLHDGVFQEAEARHGGRVDFNMGPTAIVKTDSDLTLMLTSRRTAPVSLQQLASCGIDPKAFDVLIAKGVHSPVAAYAPVCPTLLRVNTPGITTADISSLTYQHRQRPLFPFE